MFKIKSDQLKKLVSDVCSAYKSSKIDSKAIKLEVSTATNLLVVSATGNNVHFEKKATITDAKDMTFYTTPHELSLKVGILPDEVYIHVCANPKGHFQLRWGRDNGILLLSCDAPETATLSSVEPSQSISMKGDKWNYFSRNFVPFTSAATDQIVKTHPITVGVHFASKEQLVQVEATNGVRAIKGSFELDWFAKPSTVPGSLMNTVTALISSSEILTISTDEEQNFIIIETPSTKVISKLLEGTYMNTEHLYTDESADVVWRTDRMELIEVSRRIKRLDSFNPVVKMLGKDSKTYAALVGILVEQIGAVIESEGKGGFALNAFSLEAALSVLRCEEVLMTASAGSGKPVTFSNGDADEEGKTKEHVVVMLGQV